MLGIFAAGLACSAAAGQSSNTTPNGLETLRAQDCERRALVAEARGLHREAGRLLEEAAGFRHNKQMHVSAAWHYFDAGDYAEMLRAARVCFAEQPRFGNAVTAVRVAEQLSGGQLDWSATQAAVRGVPAPAEKRRVPIASPEGQVALAQLLWREGSQFARARRVLEKVVAAHPELPEAHLLLSDLYHTFHFTREAAREKSAAARLDSGAPRSAIHQVWRLRALGKKAEATQKLNELISSASGGLLEQIIELYHVEENPEEVESILADALLEDARRPAPKLLGGFQAVIDHFHRERRYGPFARLLEQLLALRPQDPGLPRLLVAAHLLNRAPQKAAEVVRQHRSLKSSTVGLPFYAALAAGDHQLAEEVAPPQPGVYVALLRHWMDPARFPLPDLTGPAHTINFQVLEIHARRAGGSDYLFPFELAAVYAAVDLLAAHQPEAWPALFHRALLYKDQGRLTEAAVLMRRVAEKQPEWWPARLYLYTHAMTARRPREAEQQYERLKQILPEQVRIQAPPGYLAPVSPEYGSQFPLPMRELREAQAQMLAGDLEPAVARLRKLREGGPDPTVHLTLGAALFAQERWDEAQKEWEAGGFRIPLRPLIAPPAHFPTGWRPPFLAAPAPRPHPGAPGLTAYPFRTVAVHAAQHAAMYGPRPETSGRLVEFLLRLALKPDPDYLPALYPLAHLLRQGEYIAMMATPLFRAPESRIKESNVLLERVLKQEPADLRSLWALERYGEAARKNPNSVEAWKRVLAEPEMPAELVAEAARELRRLQPGDIQPQRVEILRMGERSPEEGLRSAQARATETGAPEPALLAGVFAFKRGEWSTASQELQRVVATPQGRRLRHGFTAPLLLAVSLLAGGDQVKAQAAARVAARADVADPLARLLLAYFAETHGNTAERDRLLSAAAMTGTPAAQKSLPLLKAEADGVELDLEPALTAVQQRYPDCFPAAYLLAHARLRRSSEWPARFAGLPEHRATLRTLASRFPSWSGPVASLATVSMIEPDAKAEAIRRLLGERQHLAAAATAPRTAATAPPFEPVHSLLSSQDLIPALLSTNDGKLLLSLTETVRVIDARTGTLLSEYENPVSYGQAAVVGSLLMIPLDAGVAGLDPLSGELRWSIEWKPGSAKSLFGHGKQTLVVATDGAVLALSETGARLWESAAPSTPRDRRFEPVLDGERLYLVDEAREIRVLDLKSGRELSRFRAPQPAQDVPVDYLRQLLPAEGLLLVLTAYRTPAPYTVYALDPRDGRLRWNLTLPGPTVAQLARAGRSVVVARGREQESVRLDLREGRVAGTIPSPDRSAGFERVAGPWLLYRINGGKSVLVDPADGKTAWEGTLPSDTPTLQWVGGGWYTTGRKRVDRWSERPGTN